MAPGRNLSGLSVHRSTSSLPEQKLKKENKLSWKLSNFELIQKERGLRFHLQANQNIWSLSESYVHETMKIVRVQEKLTNNEHERDRLEEYEYHVGIDEGEHCDTEDGGDGTVDYWRWDVMSRYFIYLIFYNDNAKSTKQKILPSINIFNMKHIRKKFPIEYSHTRPREFLHRLNASLLHSAIVLPSHESVCDVGRELDGKTQNS